MRLSWTPWTASLGMALLLLTPAVALSPTVKDARPVNSTDAVGTDPDDPAIWLHPRDKSKSLILGTNKAAASSGGALYVFGLDGKTRQVIGGLGRPNNVDVEYGFRLKNGIRADIAVVTERERKQLRVYFISRKTGRLKIAGPGIPVFEGEKQTNFSSPMGIALYKRPGDGAIYAMVTRKSGPSSGYVWQYRLEDNGTGGVRGVKVREFGNFRGNGSEIEAICVDDEMGYVYFCDESYGVSKWHADPDSPQAGRELGVFARDGYKGDREGIAVYSQPGGRGYLVCTDQIEGNSVFRFYKRQGEPGRPHDHTRMLAEVRGVGADDTDGIEITSTPVTSRYPSGLMVAMTSTKKSFLFFDWKDIKPK